MAEPLLQATAVECAFVAGTVLFGVDLAVGAGEVLGLLGRDGVGNPPSSAP